MSKVAVLNSDDKSIDQPPAWSVDFLQLEKIPLLSECRRHSLARLVPHVKTRAVVCGEVLFQSGESADTLYYILQGSVQLLSAQTTPEQLSSGFFGEEAAICAENYQATATVCEAGYLVCFPQAILTEVLEANPSVRTGFYQSHINHYCTTAHAFQRLHEKELAPQAVLALNQKLTLGWLLALVVPALVYLGLIDSTLSWAAVNFLTIFSAAIVMWIFVLVPEYVPALLVITGVVVLGLVPSEVVLSGYSSGAFFMALSVFGIGTVLAQSELIYRLALHILRYTPATQFGYGLAVYLLGLLLTPLLPMVNGRISVIAPLLNDMVDALGYKRGGIAATRLATSAFAGVTLFSACFLTAKAINFAVFGFFPEQIKTQFTWGVWLQATVVALLVLLILDVLLSAVFFRNTVQPRLRSGHISAQLKLIGAPSRQEWIAGGAIVVFFVGMLTAYLHKIDPPWIGMGVLFILLALGSLSKQSFQRNIDWAFLFMLGSFVGLVKSISFLEIDQWFATHIMWLGQFMRGNFYLFSGLLGLCIYGVRLLVPPNTTVVLFCSVMIPLAVQQGINPWLVAFMVLLFTEGWFMPYQNFFYTSLVEETQEKQPFDKNQFIYFNLFTNLIRFAAVFASIPYWQYLGLL